MLKSFLSRLARKFRRKAVVRQAVDQWALERKLLSFGKEADICIANVCEGLLITGGTGAGKSSGSGYLFASIFVEAGFGGLVLVAKKSEADIWRQYCHDAGRLDDLIEIGPDQPFRFNFLDFELSCGTEGAGLTENVINVFTTMIEVAEKNSGKGGQGGEQYWTRAVRQLLRNLTDLLIFATGRLSVPDMYRVAISAPTSLEMTQSEAWKRKSYCYACLVEADKRPKTEQQRQDFSLVADYFMLEWPALSDKTRSVVLSSFTSMADCLNRGLLKTLFCGETNVTPKDIEDGKIIVVNLPVKELGDVGLFANILWKNCFQRSIERRDVTTNARPVFLWQDEGQLFSTKKDMAFQTTARASRVANVILTQSVSNFYAVTDGEGQKGKSEVDSLLGNLNLKIFHGNGDATTNLWCSEMIGKSKQYFINASNSRQDGDVYSALFGGGGQSSGGVSEQLDYIVPPTTFLQMRNGGPANDFIVDGLLFSPVMRFGREGKNYLPVSFWQRRK